MSTLEDVDAAIENGDENVPDFICQGLPQMLGLDPEAAAAMEFVEGDDDEFDESADELDEYLSDEDYVGFDEEEDRRARDAFGGR